MEWWSVDGSIVGGPHFAALRELECEAHGQAWTEWRWGEVVLGAGGELSTLIDLFTDGGCWIS